MRRIEPGVMRVLAQHHYELVEALCDTLREWRKIMKEYRWMHEAYASGGYWRDVDNELFILIRSKAPF
ncbi:MAG: hypothetical protein ACLS3D_08075 [Roseburia hominis]